MTRNDLKAALDHVNIRAFLRAIRLGEGTLDQDGYKRLVGGGTFTDFSAHPHVLIHLPRYDVYSSAAGAYQIVYPTWKGLLGQYGFPDFSPECQDEAAVALIAEKHALDLIKAGKFEEAVQACSAIWASLPGSQAGQRIEDIDKIKQVYFDAGGVTVT